MQNERMRCRRDPLDAAEVVRSAIAGFERQCVDSRVELSVPETPWPEQGDPGALSLAVWNLLDNAVRRGSHR
jgi:signal transduction histidine kinase